MKKMCCMVMAFCMLLSVSVMIVSAESSKGEINETITLSESILVFDTKTRTEECRTAVNDTNFLSRSSTPLVSAPYTPKEKENEMQSNTVRTVIGDDDRIRVANPSVTPYCKIVFIRAYFPSGAVVRSTGVILGPDLVLTCAHAIYRSDLGGWPNEVRVYTEVDGVRPNDNDYAGKTSTQMVIPAEWANSGTSVPGNDWAYLRVDAPIGYQQGWMGFGTTPLTYEGFNVTGYPSNAPGQTDDGNYYMYTASGEISGLDNSETMFYYSIDTSEGQSGAPLYVDAQIVYGIHVQSVTNSNMATKISNSLYNYLVEAKQEGIELWGEQ